MVEATGLDGQFVELFSLFDDGGVVQALVVATVVVVIEELADLFFQITWQIIVLQ